MFLVDVVLERVELLLKKRGWAELYTEEHVIFLSFSVVKGIF